MAAGLEADLAAWRNHQSVAGLAQRTIGDRAHTIRTLARTIDPYAASTADLVGWLSALPVQTSSKSTYHRHLRAWFGWLLDTDRRADDPSRKVPRPKMPPGLPRPLTPAQVEATLAACSDTRAAQTRAYVILACFAGLRVHEIAKLRGEDVRGDELFVRGKGGQEALLPMHPLVAALAATMPREGWWFPTASASGHVHRCSVSSAIKRAMVRAGVPGTPHAARHHYGTQVLRSSGGDLRTAQRALRHKSVQTTAIYTQVPDDALRRAIAGIPAA
jgi:site-specific recombinase XerD